MDVFPEQTIQFRLGEGCEKGVPYGVEKALYKFTSGEGSKLLINGPKYGLSEADMKKFGLSSDSVIEFYVELLSHENVSALSFASQFLQPVLCFSPKSSGNLMAWRDSRYRDS